MFSEAALKKIRRVGKMLNALELFSPTLAGKTAFNFFCTPRRQTMRERDVAFLATAVRETLLFKNLKISTYCWPSRLSDAKTVLMLHGWESNSARWRKYIKALSAAGFTVHAIDAPASGNSQGKRLNAILLSGVVQEFVAKKGTPDVIIGHSLGGAAAVMCSTLLGVPQPSKMVLLGVFAESTRVIRDFGQVLAINDKVVAAIYREIEKRSGIPIDAYSVVQKTTQLLGVRGLVIHDLNDDVAPVEEGRLVAEAWGATFMQTEGLGHRLQDKSVVKAVVDFAKQM